MQNNLKQSCWLTVKQTASRYPFTESSLRWLIFQKDVGFVKCFRRVGRRILINADLLENWIDSHKTEGIANEK